MFELIWLMLLSFDSMDIFLILTYVAQVSLLLRLKHT